MATRPSHIKLHRKSRELEFEFETGEQFKIACELLRVYSPSAEVRGHGAGERKLQTGKKHVNISSIEFTGNYAIRISFDDGHDSGLFTWAYLMELGSEGDRLFAAYLANLEDQGFKR